MNFLSEMQTAIIKPKYYYELNKSVNIYYILSDFNLSKNRFIHSIKFPNLQ